MKKSEIRYNMRTSISVDRDLWKKFQEQAAGMNMTVSDLMNIMLVGMYSTEKFESIFDKLVDRIVEVKMAEKNKS